MNTAKQLMMKTLGSHKGIRNSNGRHSFKLVNSDVKSISNSTECYALAEQELGRDAFLKLLTTQLTNQSPLDPMDNEAFVAQLAQFSSVEGIKGMQASLENMVSGMRQEQMVSVQI